MLARFRFDFSPLATEHNGPVSFGPVFLIEPMTTEYVENPDRKVQELFNRGTLALDNSNYDYAIDMFSSCIEEEPLFLKGRRYLRQAEVEKAKEGGKNSSLAHKLSTAKGLPTLLAGVVLLKSGKTDKAIATAEKLLRMDPLNTTFVAFLADAAEAAEMPELAVYSLELARDAHPDDLDLLQRMGEIYLKANMSHEATVTFDQLCRLKPDDLEAKHLLKNASAEHSLNSGGWEDMIKEGKTFRDVIADKDEALLIDTEAKAIRDGSDVDRLIAETRERIKNEPLNMNWRRQLARICRDAKMYDQAAAALEQALDVASGDPQIENMLVETYLLMFDDEIQGLEKAGQTQQAEAKTAEKNQYYQDSLVERVQRYPNDLELKYQLGTVYLERGEIDEALREFQRAQRNPKRQVDATYQLALCFSRKGQHDLARQQLEGAADNVPVMNDTKIEILYQLGVVCDALGDTSKSMEHFKEVYQVDVGYKDVAERIEKAYD